jgi:hypothetical protein
LCSYYNIPWHFPTPNRHKSSQIASKDPFTKIQLMLYEIAIANDGSR